MGKNDPDIQRDIHEKKMIAKVDVINNEDFS